jgi:hypothetical protein
MTQYLNEILHGRQRLGEEELDKTVKSLYLHKTTRRELLASQVLMLVVESC